MIGCRSTKCPNCCESIQLIVGCLECLYGYRVIVGGPLSFFYNKHRQNVQSTDSKKRKRSTSKHYVTIKTFKTSEDHL